MDYVVIHELSHLKYMNHSKDFWNMVGKYMPDYKIEMVDSRDLVVHGGGLNCCSWTTCEDIISILK